MRFMRTPGSVAVLLVAFLASHVAGLVVTLPVTGTLWE